MYLLGLDVGTTGCKSIVFSPDGSILSSAYGEYRLYHRRPEWLELNPREVWETVVATIKRSLKGEKINPKLIKALSMTALGEAFMPIDEEEKWLSWSITTFDARAEEQTRWLEENFGAQGIYQITGQPLTAAMPIYTVPKIMWIRKKEPETYKKAAMFLCWEDYINLKLCGKAVTDWTVANRTMVFDIKRKLRLKLGAAVFIVLFIFICKFGPLYEQMSALVFPDNFCLNQPHFLLEEGGV